MSKIEDGFFKLKTVTPVSSLNLGDKIPESDLTVHEQGKLYQFEHVSPDEDSPAAIIKPGSFTLEDTSMGINLKKFSLKSYDLLKTIDNTSQILSEADKFFKKGDIYKQLGREPKRAILLCSPPGVGKSSAISDVCQEFLKDKTTSVITWDTSGVRSSSVNRFFLQHSKFDPSVQKFIFIMEDIGGGTVEEHHGSKGADSSLLNLLDGIGHPFKGVPTFIIATTNNPEQSVGALIDRPGRFDKVIELKTPSEKECIALLKFISKRELNSEEIEAAEMASKNGFSIAHLQEVVVRSLIDDVSMMTVTKQLVEHKKRFNNGFHDVKTLGIR